MRAALRCLSTDYADYTDKEGKIVRAVKRQGREIFIAWANGPGYGAEYCLKALKARHKNANSDKNPDDR